MRGARTHVQRLCASFLPSPPPAPASSSWIVALSLARCAPLSAPGPSSLSRSLTSSHRSRRLFSTRFLSPSSSLSSSLSAASSPRIGVLPVSASLSSSRWLACSSHTRYPSLRPSPSLSPILPLAPFSSSSFSSSSFSSSSFSSSSFSPFLGSRLSAASFSSLSSSSSSTLPPPPAPPPPSRLLRILKWALLLTGGIVWAEVAAFWAYEYLYGEEQASMTEEEWMTRFFDLPSLDAPELEAKETALEELVEKLHHDAVLQGRLGGAFLVWNNAALPTHTPPPGLICETPEGSKAWYPSLFLASDQGFVLIQCCFVQHKEEWIPLAMRAMPLSEGSDILHVKANLPHGFKYFSRLA